MTGHDLPEATPEPLPLLLTVPQAARLLGIDKTTAWQWIKAGTFPVQPRDYSGTLRISRLELEDHLRRPIEEAS